MTTQLYLVRHAQPDISVKNDLLRPLTAKGTADTVRVTEFLNDKKITAVYSSPLKRAYDTVKSFADAAGLPVITSEDFREREVGCWVEDFTLFSRRQWEDGTYKLPGGESLAEVQQRNISSMRFVLEKHAGENVVIGTHGTALSTILNYFNPSFGYDGFCTLIDKMPFIVKLTFEEGNFSHFEEIDLF